MERASYRSRWEALKKDYGAFQAIYERYPAPKEITVQESNGLAGLMDFNNALLIRSYFGGKKDVLAEKYLARAKEISDRVLAANLFEREPASHLFPENRGFAQLTKVYVDAFVESRALDRSLAIASARDIEAHAKAVTKKKWDAYEQNKLLQAVETLLLANAEEEARAIVVDSRSMSGMLVKERFAFVERFLEAKALPIADQSFRNEYLAIFDAIRDPDFSQMQARKAFPVNNLSRLILASLFLKYFESDGAPFSGWDAALELMSQ